jgi:hypothetical protein
LAEDADAEEFVAGMLPQPLKAKTAAMAKEKTVSLFFVGISPPKYANNIPRPFLDAKTIF